MNDTSQVTGTEDALRSERELRSKIIEHFSFQQTYMSPTEFNDFVEFRLYNEENQKQWISTLNALAGGLEGKDVLDVGCGDGGFVTALMRKHPSAVVKGCDVSVDNIEMAELRGRKFGLTDGTFSLNGPRGLPFPDESFDVVVMFDVFEHVTNPEAIIAEISRVLRKGGYFFSSTPNLLWPKESHLRLWFIHWMPAVLRTAYARKKGGDRAVELISSLNLMTPSVLHSLMLPHFSESMLNDGVFQRKMASAGTGSPSLKGLVKKMVCFGPVWIFARIILKYMRPSIYILSKK